MDPAAVVIDRDIREGSGSTPGLTLSGPSIQISGPASTPDPAVTVDGTSSVSTSIGSRLAIPRLLFRCEIIRVPPEVDSFELQEL